MGFLEEDIQSGVPSAHWMLSDIFIQKLQEAKAKQEEKEKKENSGNELGFQDSTFVELALRVLGLMCDGQNRTLQDSKTLHLGKYVQGHRLSS